MGYDLHITRADMWYQSKLNPILPEEWFTYLDSDPEMRLVQIAEATTSAGETVRYKSDGLAVWTSYSGNGKDGNFAWFDLQHGEVVVKNPDDEIITKMRQVARAFKARVQGDEGEFYDEAGNR
jgi:hypothetical protein